MGTSGKLKNGGSELPYVNGDIIFGVFFSIWTALMIQQAIQPWPMFAFERWMYDSVGLPSPHPEWVLQNYWVPGICTFIYFTMLLHMPEFMKSRERPKWLKKVVFVWNVFLSLSSSLAAVRIIGEVFGMTESWYDKTANGSRPHPFHEIVCDKNIKRACQFGVPVGCNYVALFCMSKIPEMMDTLWLLLAKKKVIFLHWFHHSSVMWFCWLAWGHGLPMGIIFALMNLSVHSIMYAWYALAAADRWLAVGLKPKKFFSQTVTVLQIVQMILGFSLTLYVHDREDCGNLKLVTRYALGMYSVYLILFVHFFYRAYCKKTKPVLKKPPYAQNRLFAECAGAKIKGVDKRPAGGARKPKTKPENMN